MAVQYYFPTEKENSYVTILELGNYFRARLNADDYLNNPNLHKALYLATRLLDGLEYVEKTTDENQPLQWPRTGVRNRNGQLLDENSIPGSIKDACCELTYFLLQHDITNPDEFKRLNHVQSQTVGDSKVVFTRYRVNHLPDYVMKLVKWYLVDPSQNSVSLIHD